jgi:hypothetical protein
MYTVILFFQLVAIGLHCGVFLLHPNESADTPEHLAFDHLMCKLWVGGYVLFNVVYWTYARIAVVNRREELIVEAQQEGFTMKRLEKGSVFAASPKTMRREQRKIHEKRRSARTTKEKADSIRKLVSE